MLSRRAQFLWIGTSLSPIERLALQSFVDFGWEVVLYQYENILNVPKGVQLCDANSIIPAELIVKDKFKNGEGGSYTTFADLFRLALLAKHGGWWFDTDFVAVSPPRPVPLSPYFASTWEMEWEQCAINCAMFCEPGDPLIIDMLTKAQGIIAFNDFEFGEIGPFLLQRLIRDRAMEAHVAPWWMFCPYPWRQIRMSSFRSDREYVLNRLRLAKHLIWQATRSDFKAAYVRRNSLAVHLHNDIWRRANISKDGPFHRLSFVGKSIRRHRVV